MDLENYIDDYFAEVVRAGGYVNTREWAENEITDVDELDWDEILDLAEEELMETHARVTLTSMSNIRQELSDLAIAARVRELENMLDDEVNGLDLTEAQDVRDSEPDGDYWGAHPDDDALVCYTGPWSVWRRDVHHEIWLDFTHLHDEPPDVALRDVAEG